MALKQFRLNANVLVNLSSSLNPLLSSWTMRHFQTSNSANLINCMSLQQSNSRLGSSTSTG